MSLNQEELNEEELNAVKVLASIEIPTTRYMGDEEKRDGVEQMLRDLRQLARQDGCIAAAWAVEVLRAIASKKISNQRKKS